MSDATQPGAEPVYATQEPLGDGLDLRHYLGIVRRRFWVILTSLVVVVTLGTVHAFRATPIYRAEGSVLIELQGPRVMGFEDITQAQGGSRDWYFYATQREMLRSQAVMEKALEQPGIREMLEGAGEATEAPPGGLRGLITEVRNTISALLGGVPSSPPAPWERLRGMAQVSVDRDTESLLRISSEGTNAAQTALVVNAVARAFAAYHIERRQRSSSEAFAFLEEQKSIQEQKLLQAEAALQEFREEVRLPTLDTSDRQNPVLVRLGRLSDRLTETQLRRIELQAQAMVRDEVLAEAPGGGDDGFGGHVFSLPGVRADEGVQSLHERLLAAEQKVQGLGDVYGPEHPQLRAALAERDLLAEELRSAVDSIVVSATKQLDMLKHEEDQLLAEYEEQNRNALELSRESATSNRLIREVERHQRLFDVLVERMREVDLTGDYARTNVEIVQEAVVPRLPIRPQRARIILLSIFLGTFLGGGLALLLEHLDDTLKMPEDLEQYAGVPALGFVPTLEEEDGEVPPFAFRSQIAALRPMSSASEAYRSIRTSLFFAAPPEDSQVLTVTSAQPGEGKTTTSCNLSVVMALGAKRVLLIDADFRKPMVHRAFSLENKVGLSNVLVGDKPLEEVVQQANVDGKPLEYLSVLTTGPTPPNPAELLDSQAMRDLLGRARGVYDRIVIDTPPVLFVADASVAASMSDGVVVVAKSAVSTRAAARRMRGQLESVRARILGGVLNDVHLARLGYYYSDYAYYGYSRYYGDYRKAY
ncbi:MAG: polysaccharide biosynthesis tyrosine autokinase [Candidatus Brocadiaceae bacterium]|nr:polysaccharide biosynthesis tyrosine autokinase [Candidatus Brocadiaceae bacterium]